LLLVDYEYKRAQQLLNLSLS